MPKTKLGCEVKNYGYKKIKTSSTIKCSLSESITCEKITTDIKNVVKTTKSEEHETLGNVTVTNSPFSCIVVQNFLTDNEFFGRLQSECANLKFNQKSNDLYKFKQSTSLTSESGIHIGKLRSVLLENVRPWIMSVLDVELESDTLDLFCARYRYTDTLLCHDDELEGRKVAFILYLTEEEWTEEDGGLLELFDTDEKGNPNQVVKKFVPHNNSFAFFEVSPVSFHQVSEVLSESKTRMSLSGWFHGKSAPRPERTSLPQSPYLPSVDLDEDTFYSWINPAYLNPETQGDIQTQFEDSSEISLNNFLVPELYCQVSQALLQHHQWTHIGPPNRKSFRSLTGDPDEIIKSCIQFFTSEPFFLLLSNLTGLKLHALAPSDDEDEDDEDEEETKKEGEKVYNPRCRGGISRWSKGCYTLIRDDDKEQAEYALDLRMFFNIPESEGEWETGGQSVYIARGEDEELVTVFPEENTLSLVYRDKDSLKFIKYVNSKLEKSFNDLFLTYYE